MSAAEKLGEIVDSRLAKGRPDSARHWLTAGWEGQRVLFHIAPHRELYPADQYLAQLMMHTMLRPLEDPEDSAIISIFVPCELLQEAGLHPYNAEAFSCYLSATFCEDSCIQCAEESGISDTLCSYHRTFIGAAKAHLLPRPRAVVYTNLTCDANLVTFRELADFYQIPSFRIDVPSSMDEETVSFVADEMRELKKFLEGVTGRTIREDSLRERTYRSRETLRKFREFQIGRADRHVPSDIVTPLYSAMTANILLGTEEEEKYVDLCLENLKTAPPKRGKHIYWMHTIPFYSRAVKDFFLFSDRAQIVGDELSQVCSPDFDPSDPYRAMAERLVYNALNGPGEHRIDRGIEHARDTKADGVIWFNHWGCKRTLGLSAFGKEKFEAAGFPTLVIDGDGCEKSKEGDGQLSTRIGAFMEMLESGKPGERHA